MPEATHQLAAIMFTDIVGYTKLMGENEEKTLDLLIKNKEIHERFIAQYNGKLLKEIGDGILASFGSVTEAVYCAGELQKVAKDQEINLKIGIHEGEVVFKDNDVFGDGVNIASRIEALAVGGGILISEGVFNDIKNKEDFNTAFIGKASLKNVDKPVNIYQVLDGDLVKPTIQIKKVGERNKLLKAGAALIILLFAAIFIYQQFMFEEPIYDKSIAVLPITDLSEKGDQQFFADGIMEDILGQLQKMGELYVVSKTSVMKYRGNTPTISQIRDELKVSYVLEASLRKSPDEVMITAQLINVADDRHLFSENYTSDYSAKGIFSIQERIAKRIVNDLKLTISPEKVSEITSAMTENTIAYEHFQKGKVFMSMYTSMDTDSSIIEFKKAIEIDTGFSSAYGLLANAFALKNYNHGGVITYADSAEIFANKGLELDDQCAECYKALAGVEISKYDNMEKAMELREKALEIKPNYTEVFGNMIRRYYATGQYEKGFDLVSRLIKMNPGSEPRSLRGLYQSGLGDFKKASAYIEVFFNQIGGLNNSPSNYSWRYARISYGIGDIEGFKKGAARHFQISQDSMWVHYSILGSNWLEDKYEEVTTHFEDNRDGFFKRWGWNYTMMNWVCFSYLEIDKNSEASQLGDILLRSLNLNDKSSKSVVYNISLAYLIKNQKEQSLTWLERAINLGWLQDISKDAFFESLKDHPRFQELITKQNKKREEVMALLATYNFPEPEEL